MFVLCVCIFLYNVRIGFLGFDGFVLFFFYLIGTPSDPPLLIPLPDKKTLVFILDKLQKYGDEFLSGFFFPFLPTF